MPVLPVINDKPSLSPTFTFFASIIVIHLVRTVPFLVKRDRIEASIPMHSHDISRRIHLLTRIEDVIINICILFVSRMKLTVWALIKERGSQARMAGMVETGISSAKDSGRVLEFVC